jgi:thymidylate synthase
VTAGSIFRSFDIEADLPTVLDDTSAYLPQAIEADLVLDYLRHHDLSEDLSRLCEKLKIPMVSSGKKIRCGSAICPPHLLHPGRP